MTRLCSHGKVKNDDQLLHIKTTLASLFILFYFIFESLQLCFEMFKKEFPSFVSSVKLLPGCTGLGKHYRLWERDMDGGKRRLTRFLIPLPAF